MSDAGLGSPADIINHSSHESLLDLLLTNDYGEQRITGQYIERVRRSYIGEDRLVLEGEEVSTDPVNRPLSFMLLGQRFAIDSYIITNLVFDRLIVEGEIVQRPLPSPLDIMAVLGNEHATRHLQVELLQYGYEANLEQLSTVSNGLDPSFWDSTYYNRWLGILSTLNHGASDANFPQAMRTLAWADKTLHTQLASWAQLRHDNILYVKQTFTGVACEYPAGYVEPYPEFFAAISEHARISKEAIDILDVDTLDETELRIRDTAINYFNNLESIATRLQTMAEKELILEPFTEDEEQFLKDLSKRHMYMGYIEQWNGWYAADLMPWGDGAAAIVADIHTNPNNNPSFPDLFPPGVLHVGTGPVATMLFIADTDEGPTMYVGPVFTYFENFEEGFPPIRLTDEDWKARITEGVYPTAPSWVSSFRLPASRAPVYFAIEEEEEES